MSAWLQDIHKALNGVSGEPVTGALRLMKMDMARWVWEWRMPNEKNDVGRRQKLAVWLAGFALTCRALNSSSCVYTVQSHLLFHPLTDWCCYLFVSTPTGLEKSESNSSVQSNPPTCMSLESAELTLQILMSSCRLMAIHSQKLFASILTLERMGFYWQCGDREWAMVVMERQQGVWFIVPRPHWHGLFSSNTSTQGVYISYQESEVHEIERALLYGHSVGIAEAL